MGDCMLCGKPTPDNELHAYRGACEECFNDRLGKGQAVSPYDLSGMGKRVRTGKGWSEIDYPTRASRRLN